MGGNQLLHRVLTEQGEVADGQIHRLQKRPPDEIRIAGNAEITTAGGAGPLDQARHRIHADQSGNVGSQRPDQPTLTTADIEHGLGRLLHDRIHNRLIGHQRAALNLLLTHGARPLGDILLPGRHNPGFAGRLHGDGNLVGG
jgi:hypothetical protein